jgi:Zn-dependent protease
MLLLALGMSFLGFVFAAPGAVHIKGYINKMQNGIFSLAGPLMNLILALVFLPEDFCLTISQDYILHMVS